MEGHRLGSLIQRREIGWRGGWARFGERLTLKKWPGNERGVGVKYKKCVHPFQRQETATDSLVSILGVSKEKLE